MTESAHLRQAVQRAFRPATGPHTIGVELEMHVRDGIPELDGELARRGHPTLEPGGQLELSLPPQRSIPALLREVDWCLATVGAATEVALTGVDPWRSLDDVPLTLQTPRYLAMQELFDHDGDAGRRMMRLTASLQVCVDLLPGRAGHEQWLVANLAGPALVAAYGGDRARTRIWQGIDPARTGYDGRHLDVHDPIERVCRVRRRRRTSPHPAGDGRRLPPEHALPAGPAARWLPRAPLPRLPATDRRAARHHLGADVRRATRAVWRSTSCDQLSRPTGTSGSRPTRRRCWRSSTTRRWRHEDALRHRPARPARCLPRHQHRPDARRAGARRRGVGRRGAAASRSSTGAPWRGHGH